MTKLIALLQFLLALAGIHSGGTTWTSQVNDHDKILYSRAHAQDGVARFECIASSSGHCNYTLYPERCAGQACDDAPLQRFVVVRGDSRQIAGLPGFRLCVDSADTAVGPDCKPLATVVKR
ncbi:MAG: hypothetical protein QM719_08615 [Thermomonas sp.]